MSESMVERVAKAILKEQEANRSAFPDNRDLARAAIKENLPLIVRNLKREIEDARTRELENQATIRHLKAERDGYNNQAFMADLDKQVANDALARLAADNTRLTVALEFYADISKYPAPLTGGMGALWSDCGQIARAALSPTPSE